MTRILVTTAAALLLSAPAFAQAGYYTAKPVAAPAKASLVTRSTVWKCAEGLCTAGKSTSRDAIMCELVAREVGALDAFTANGQAFDAAALEKCNARAK